MINKVLEREQPKSQIWFLNLSLFFQSDMLISGIKAWQPNIGCSNIFPILKLLWQQWRGEVEWLTCYSSIFLVDNSKSTSMNNFLLDNSQSSFRVTPNIFLLNDLQGFAVDHLQPCCSTLLWQPQLVYLSLTIFLLLISFIKLVCFIVFLNRKLTFCIKVEIGWRKNKNIVEQRKLGSTPKSFSLGNINQCQPGNIDISSSCK